MTFMRGNRPQSICWGLGGGGNNLSEAQTRLNGLNRVKSRQAGTKRPKSSSSRQIY